MAFDLWNFPEFIRLPLAQWIDVLVLWVTVQGEEFFGALSVVIRLMLRRLEDALIWLPWAAVVLGTGAAAWRTGGWRLALGAGLGLIFIGTLGLWDLAMRTLALVIVATLLAIVVAVPTGIAMAWNGTVNRLLLPVLDLMQTMPSFVYLVPALMLFGLGPVPAVIATFIYAVPPAIRLTNLGIRQVAPEVVEAARAFGTTSSQLLFTVQLPLALPTIMAGINQTIMMGLAMVVIASMIGAGGLGAEVLNGIARLEVGRGFAGGISIVVLAIVIDRISQGLVKTRPSGGAA
ncbi:MAG: proline/glycine betaine ABC transporter permease [Thermaerobacterales bacterium]